MSELSVRQYLHNDGSGFTFGYDKSEADKVIAKLEEKIKNSRNARKYWRKEYLIEYKECLHQKYKRCLAMALLCFTKGKEKQSVYKLRTFFWSRWGNRWLKLSEKFKEAK